MYLKSIELSGFKSFAKKTSLGFNSPITAIVGPNGSGKSNVAEAFSFVLGEQSIKSLRGKRGEDLIFNGSKTIGRQNRAAVKITLDNSKRLLNIDFDEVSIERVVHRDNNNEYLINGSQVRLKDIVELLAQAHMGPTGHHIISQGEADRILNANLKERRLMVEDALGLKIYQYKRSESERKLERTRENIGQVESLRRELSPHLRFLKKQVEKIEKVKELRENLIALYREYLSKEEAYLLAERKSLEQEEKQPKQKLEALERELSRAKTVLEKAHHHDDKSAKVLSFEQKLRELRTQKDELTRDAGRLEGELVSEERRAKKLREAEAVQEHKQVPLPEVRNFAGLVEKKILEADKSGELSEIRRILSDIKAALASFIQRFESEQGSSTVAEAEEEIKRLQKERASLNARIEELAGKERETQKTYEVLREDIEKEKDEGRDAEREIFKIMAEQNEIHATLNLLKGRRDKLELEEEEYKREMEEAKTLVGLEDARSTAAPDMLEPRTVQHDRRRNLEKMKIRLEELGGAAAKRCSRNIRMPRSVTRFWSGKWRIWRSPRSRLSPSSKS